MIPESVIELATQEAREDQMINDICEFVKDAQERLPQIYEQLEPLVSFYDKVKPLLNDILENLDLTKHSEREDEHIIAVKLSLGLLRKLEKLRNINIGV
jgi:hypothetical protein